MDAFLGLEVIYRYLWFQISSVTIYSKHKHLLDDLASQLTSMRMCSIEDLSTGPWV